MRKFLGEHLSTANDDEPQRDQAEQSAAVANPNLQDLPESTNEGTGNTVDGANPSGRRGCKMTTI